MHNPVDTLKTEEAYPDYMMFWDEFADEQINRPDSPIKQEEQERFVHQCVSNATELRQAYKKMHLDQSTYAVRQWYSRLGTINQLTGAEDDLALAMSYVANSKEENVDPSSKFMLYGNLAHERALLSEGEEAEGMFTLAAKAYQGIINRHNNDMQQPLVRQAYAHLFDATFARLSQSLKDGRLDQNSFDAQYQARHEDFVHYVSQLSRTEGVGNGELYEWYGELMFRHQLWAEERFGQIEIRRAFTPREDRPIDGFRRGGRHVNQKGMLPAYASDLKLSVVEEGEEPRYIQLKSDEDDYGRYADPPVRVLKYKGVTPLRRQVEYVSAAMLASYRFEESMEDDALLISAVAEFESALV